MDFLDYLVKKSEINGGKDEYFKYRQPVKRPINKNNSAADIDYISLNDAPLVSSYVVFDFETTGLNSGTNAIIEIGAVKVLDGKITDKFNTLIDPEQYIPYYISDKVHITNDMVKGKPCIASVLPHFIDFTDGLPLVAHNARFDMSFLLRNCKRCDIVINNPVIDTLYLSRHYLKECKKYNLAYLSDYFNIDLKNAHRAYYDALATQQLFEIIKKRIYSLKNAQQ